MKNKYTKLMLVGLSVFLLTGCTKQLTDENKKVVRYDSAIICDSCKDECNDDDCIKECNTKCEGAKKAETGQNLTKNILCKPTDKYVLEIYEKYGVDVDKLSSCTEFSLFSSYEGLWASLFVKPLAWLIIRVGMLFNNYGLALVLISVLIRLCLMPLTKKTAMQSENIKKAQPEIDRINKKYEGKNS
jgi:membrane protein insertase Oxa1/YidC/SpoIIIJ